MQMSKRKRLDSGMSSEQKDAAEWRKQRAEMLQRRKLPISWRCSCGADMPCLEGNGHTSKCFACCVRGECRKRNQAIYDLAARMSAAKAVLPWQLPLFKAAAEAGAQPAEAIQPVAMVDEDDDDDDDDDDILIDWKEFCSTDVSNDPVQDCERDIFACFDKVDFLLDFMPFVSSCSGLNAIVCTITRSVSLILTVVFSGRWPT